jgi:hypothetical protein
MKTSITYSFQSHDVSHMMQLFKQKLQTLLWPKLEGACVKKSACRLVRAKKPSLLAANTSTHVPLHLSMYLTNGDTFRISQLHKCNPKLADLSLTKKTLPNSRSCQKTPTFGNSLKFSPPPRTPPLGQVNDTLLQSNMIKIITNRSNTPFLECLVVASSKLQDPFIALMLGDSQFDHPSIFGNILRKHKEHLERHCNFSIAESMHAEPMDEEGSHPCRHVTSYHASC